MAKKEKEPTKEDIAAQQAVTDSITEINETLSKHNTLLQAYLDGSNPSALIARVRVINKPVEVKADLTAPLPGHDGNKRT